MYDLPRGLKCTGFLLFDRQASMVCLAALHRSSPAIDLLLDQPITVRLPHRRALRQQIRLHLHSSRTTSTNQDSHNFWYRKWVAGQ